MMFKQGSNAIPATHQANDIGTFQPLEAESLASIRALETRGSPGLMTVLIDIFLDDAPRIVQHLQRAVKLGDARATQQYAHRLKGSCANFGAQCLMRVCEELEKISSTGSTRGAADLLHRIECEYMRVRRALEHIRHADTRG